METREAFVSLVKAQLHEWSAEMNLLTARAGTASASARLELHRQLDHARQIETKVVKKVGDLETATTSAWNEVKAGVDEARKEMRAALDRAKHAIEAKN
jgi:hypothetical protein